MKTLNTFMIGIFALLLVVSFASAETLFIENINAPLSVVSNSSSYNITFDVRYDGTVASKAVTLTNTTNFGSLVFNDSSFILNGTANETIKIIATVTGFSSNSGQDLVSSITASAASLTPVTKVMSTSIVASTPVSGTNYYNICPVNKFNNSGDIEIKDIDDNELDNEDKWEWKPLDNVEVEVRLQNNANDDLEYDLELLIYNNDDDISDDVVTDEDDLQVDGFDVDEGDDERVTFNFQIDGKVEEGNYDLYVKVTDEDGNCYVEKLDESISIDKNSRQIIVKDVEVDNSVSCGQTVDLTARIANVGKNDEDQVKVIVYNKDLGINIFKEIENVDEGDTANAFFTFTIPQNAKEQNYRLQVSTEYDYDDRDENYDEVSDVDDDLSYTISVLGGCVDLSRPTISANLKSTAVVGEEMTIEVSIKNNAASTTSYTISLADYSSWAESLEIEDATLSALAGQTATTQIKLTPTEEGQQTFNIKVVYNGEIIEQAVTVKVSKTQSAFSNVFSGGNLTSFLLTGILILVILIVIVFVIKAISSRD